MENLFPDEIKAAINGVKSEARQKIISELMTKGQASYSQLKDELQTKSKGSFNYHLSALLDSGLVTNYIQGKEKDETDYLSYYEISNFGKSFINSLFASLTYMVPKVESSQIIQQQDIQKQLRRQHEFFSYWNVFQQFSSPAIIDGTITFPLQEQSQNEPKLDYFEPFLNALRKPVNWKLDKNPISVQTVEI